ncbi:hypothetical protein [Dictyobacter aurantiacus]|uniref:HAMP domain-containing protein n=1 Tax=Dictyobacter aurantiacus TaxID=1936993 RepID=A0A401ZIT0_9CHLR|nr:hypothetical protein [Dictyobacter aurantiacus]GCE06752.1 hypothetical protein KDAU_40810 [Dictyobacter aurantiacus]
MDSKRPSPLEDKNSQNGHNRDTNWHPPLDQQGQSTSSMKALRVWYEIATPSDVAAKPSFATHDKQRRLRLASVILLLMLVVLLAFIRLALLSRNPLLFPIILAGIAICLLTIFLNRRGHVTVVGILSVITINAAIMLNLLSSPSGLLTMNGFLTFDLLVFSELLAVSLLPPVSVFVVAALNIGCICADLFLQAHAPDLAHLWAQESYTLLVRPIALQVVVAVVTFLWVRGALRAFRRVDRIQEVERLQLALAEQKRDLEVGIQQIQQTLTEAANGNFTVRVPLAQENVLWTVASSLNTLLARLQRSNQSEYELQRIRSEVQRLVNSIDEAEARRMPPRLSPTGTLLDPLLKKLAARPPFQSVPDPDRPART